MPLSLSGNHRESAMIAGAAPMDCVKPLMPHKIEKSRKKVNDDMDTRLLLAKPCNPTLIFAKAESARPVAIKRLIFE